MLILNEEKYAESIYFGKSTDVKSVISMVSYVTRYGLHTLNYSDEENYKHTAEWMSKHHSNFDESYYSNLISDAIKRAHKYPFYHMDSIKITKHELNCIASLDNLRAEKILFVLLCMAKQQSVAYGFTNGLVKYSITDLCKMARIAVPSDDREYILYEIVCRGLLGYPKKNNTQCLIVNFINEDDDTVLTLDELDCQELAYVYLNWKNNGNGYGRCECCKKIMKKTKKNTKRFCESCAQMVGDVADDMRVVPCVDCGGIIYRENNKDTRTCRCEKCHTKERQRINRAYYEGRKIKTDQL